MLKKFTMLTVFTVFLSLTAGCVSQAESKFGYVDMKKVFFEYKKTKEFNSELEKEDGKIKKEIEKKTEEVRKLKDEIDLLSESAKEKKQPELREAIRALEEFRREKVEALLKRKEEMFETIRNDVLSVSSAYAKKNGYDFIFDESIFIYSSEKYDITTPILKELNK